MKIPLRPKSIKHLGWIQLALLFLIPSLHAGSATWNLNPGNGDWDKATNWTPAIVPTDTATFGNSSITDISGPKVTSIEDIVFSPGASSYTITCSNTLDIRGVGITNDSGLAQHFVMSAGDWFLFSGNASAGSSTDFDLPFDTSAYFYDTSSAGNGIFTVDQVSNVIFHDDSTAGNGTFTLTGIDQRAAAVYFYDNSTAEDSTLVLNGEAICQFNAGTSAGNCHLTINGTTSAVEGGGSVTFYGIGSTAENATLIANPGQNDGQGGAIFFGGSSKGGTAQVEVFGNGVADDATNGRLDIQTHDRRALTIGSLEGNGLVLLGGNDLTIGSNNLATSFAGLIQGTGSLTKIGIGNLTLTHANNYSGGTVINGGILLVNSTSGSGTGSGSVRVTVGTLGGSGRIGGTVSVGTGSGPGAFLGPGARGVTPGTLTILKRLTLNADSTYKVTIDSRIATADAVRAKGVRIENALVLFNDLGNDVLASGTIFVVINNSAATPISGTFSNLADGSTITIGSNTFQANYEGGDGNDLALTVVP